MVSVVIPVQTGIQLFQDLLDSRLRGNDQVGAFFKGLELKIEIRTNVQLPEIPSLMELESNSTLRDVLAVIAPQLIDPETGKMTPDQDIWGIRLNDEPFALLRNGLNTPLRQDDVVELSFIFVAGG